MKKFIESINLEGISVGTWVRFVMTLISIVLVVLKFFGINLAAPQYSDVEFVITALFTIITFVQNFWKNNSITLAAQEADAYMHKLKGEEE